MLQRRSILVTVFTAWLLVGSLFSVSAANAETGGDVNTRGYRSVRYEPLPESSEERLRAFTLNLLALVYFTAVGATVGSFLNVIIYRMPRGEGLLWPGSRCPSCGKSILLRDNLPVIGWLKLRGKCRFCQRPISARYPLVEAAIAALWLLLCFVELLSGGANLPDRKPNAMTGALWIVWSTQWDLIRIYLYHCAILSTLAAMVGIAFDRLRIPPKLLIWLFLLAVIPPVIWHDLHPTPIAPRDVATQPVFTYRASGSPAPRPEWLGSNPILWGVAETAAGLAAGIALGLLLRMANRFRVDGAALSTGIVPAMAAIGACVGWQGAISVALIAAGVRLIATCVTRVAYDAIYWPPLANVFAATLAHIVAWRWLAGLRFWPGLESTTTDFAIAVAVVAVLSAIARLLTTQDADASCVPVAPKDYALHAIDASSITWREILEPRH